MELRSYQIEPVQKGIDFFKNKKSQPSLMVLPTAAGKSWIIAKIAEGIDTPVLILQPSKELLAQNVEKFQAIGGVCSIFSASFGQKEIGHVTYATIGSIVQNGEQFKQMGVKSVIIDEAHLYPRSNGSMLQRFLLSLGVTNHILGLTATPLKLKSLVFGSKLIMLTNKSKEKRLFTDIIHVCQVKEMVDGKYWSELKYYTFDTDDKKLKFNSSGAEYTDKSLSQFYYDNDIENKIVRSVYRLKEIGRKAVLIFVPTVDDAHRLSQKIENSAVVSANTPNKERDFIIQSFKSGRIFAVINVNVLSVGFDFPELDNIICGRRTASFAWYYQALGRLTRIHPNKKDGWIIDFSGNVKRFGKIEELQYIKQKDTWKLFGEGGKLITGIYMQEMGKHLINDDPNKKIITSNTKEKAVDLDPWYKKNDQKHNNQQTMPFGKFQGYKIENLPVWYQEWMIKNFKWSDRTNWIKVKILQIADKKSELKFSNS